MRLDVSALVVTLPQNEEAFYPETLISARIRLDVHALFVTLPQTEAFYPGNPTSSGKGWAILFPFIKKAEQILFLYNKETGQYSPFLIKRIFLETYHNLRIRIESQLTTINLNLYKMLPQMLIPIWRFCSLPLSSRASGLITGIRLQEPKAVKSPIGWKSFTTENACFESNLNQYEYELWIKLINFDTSTGFCLNPLLSSLNFPKWTFLHIFFQKSQWKLKNT